MKHLFQNAFLVVLGVALVGCEWGGGGDNNSWNDSSSIANFSGNYSGSGGYLVSDYSSSTPSTGGGGVSSTTAGEINVSSENKGAIPATSFAGQCNMTPVKPGSVHLFISGGADGQFTDNGSGVLNGTFNVGGGVMLSASGTINYDNGAYGINLGAAGVTVVGKTVTITYTVITTGGSTPTPTPTTPTSPGSSGVSIYAFNVQQSGNKVKIIDNNGSVYEGNLGDVKTTGNLSAESTGATFVNGDQVIAPFSAAGKSAAGMHVNIAGNFQGTVAGVSTVSSTSGSTVTRKTSFALANRQILGTWIEDGGKTGNIRGSAGSSSSITVSSGTSTNSP